eukprot:CAMPEP_0118669550 /NCGR_PEP_ID=MMETSP0785-20121206/20964_1 /TAXON_ID=91992 /ORGANISM="Bolidomonas pacifica, Strain CCMP 1866" /LENGTH=1805 /DNA_ID=CAMNT_0006564247 /DNA_START=118 /DNA_END=5535 /DNA_ORIENTATION=+
MKVESEREAKYSAPRGQDGMRNNLGLRTQLLLYFGATAGIAVGLCAIIAILTTTSLGSQVKTDARSALSSQAKSNLAWASTYASETLSAKLSNLDGMASFMQQVTMDRFVGYPDNSEYANDGFVPFKDSVTDKNKYPLAWPHRVPLDWEVVSNVNTANAEEHLRDRWSEFEHFSRMSTASAMYRVQGACNPAANDSSDPEYYPGCTTAHNDMTTGGVVAPTSTNELIEKKSRDLTPFLKMLFESTPDVKGVGMYFSNSGAGSVTYYPAVVIDGTVDTYESIGCDWASATNPRTGNPILSASERANCHPYGQQVVQREYNPMERGWCRDQVLAGIESEFGMATFTGPFKDAWSPDLYLILVGRAVFDRKTGEFITCLEASITLEQLNEIVNAVEIGQTSTSTLIKNDGTVVASSSGSSGWTFELNQQVTELRVEVNGKSGVSIGVNQGTLESMTNIFDFSQSSWDPAEAKAKYQNTIYVNDGRMLSVYPVPAVPEVYDPNYAPIYLMIISIEEEEILSQADSMDDAIDDDISTISTTVGLVCAGGLIFVFGFIWAISYFLTTPLSWMEGLADKVVNNAGSNLGDGLDPHSDPHVRFSPQTEVMDLVKEFKVMIMEFGGSGAAKAHKHEVFEIKNPCAFTDTQKKRFEKISSYGYENVGRNAPIPEATVSTTRRAANVAKRDESIFKSPLFGYIVSLIVFPLLATLLIISITTILSLQSDLPLWLKDVEAASVSLERDSVKTAASLRSTYVREVISEPVRDLHFHTRFASWLYFGGIERSDGFTELTMVSETCKNYNVGLCPATQSNEIPCDCSWFDVIDYNKGGGTDAGRQCTTSLESSQTRLYDMRASQRQQVAISKDDADPTTGDRGESTYPSHSGSPDTTNWYNDVSQLPGASKGSTAAGYATTYDRVRVYSAMAPVELAIYNYDVSPDFTKLHSTMIGYEADGSMMRFDGCSLDSVGYTAHFRRGNRADGNGAAEVRPNLCPENSYGYDARCRDWYADIKIQQMTSSNDNSGPPVYITPPYLFSDGSLACTATSGLVDPSNNQWIGATLFDFLPKKLITALGDVDGNTKIGSGSSSFAFLISAAPDRNDCDTIIGPGYDFLSDGPMAIEDVVLMGEEDEALKTNFDNNVIADMQAGNSGAKNFNRGRYGDTYVVYHPVKVTALKAKDPSDFSRGTESFDTHFYSLGIAISESDLVLPFTLIKDDIEASIQSALSILIVLIVFSIILTSVIVGRVSYKIVNPVVILLQVVKQINEKDIAKDIPHIKGSSREVDHVYASFEKLYLVVRFSNTSFFSGDLVGAYNVLMEAETLFKSLDNIKAIGVANNNIANTLLALYSSLTNPGTKQKAKSKMIKNVGMDVDTLANTASERFDEAVISATSDLEREGVAGGTAWMEQLANRSFNRGIWNMRRTLGAGGNVDVWEVGVEDITKAIELDKQVATISGTIFDTAIARSTGLLAVMKLIKEMKEGKKGIWKNATVADLPGKEASIVIVMDQLVYMVTQEFEQTNSDGLLFAELTRTGRQQELDSMKINYWSLKGKVEEALKISFRMLAQDEFLNYKCGISALNCMIDFVGWPKEETKVMGTWINTISNSLPETLGGGKKPQKRVIFCLDKSGSMYGGRMDRALANCLKVYDEYVNDIDEVGFIMFSNKISTVFELSIKGEPYPRGDRRQLIKDITAGGGTKFYTAIDCCLTMMVNQDDSNGTLPTWIVALTDGDSSDEPSSAVKRLKALNNGGEHKVDVVIVGVDVSTQCITACEELCAASKDSIYIDSKGGLSAMDKAFEAVAKVIGGDVGVSMEAF